MAAEWEHVQEFVDYDRVEVYKYKKILFNIQAANLVAYPKVNAHSQEVPLNGIYLTVLLQSMDIRIQFCGIHIFAVRERTNMSSVPLFETNVTTNIKLIGFIRLSNRSLIDNITGQTRRLHWTRKRGAVITCVGFPYLLILSVWINSLYIRWYLAALHNYWFKFGSICGSGPWCTF